MQFHTYGLLDDVQRTHWWFVSRRRILGAMLDASRPGRRDLRTLDIGCGTGVNLEYLGRYGKVVGLDSSHEAVVRCRANGLPGVLMGDIFQLPFPPGSFDLVVAMDVIEHVDDDVAALREILRILKPGGLAYITVPAFMFLWSVQDDVSEHRRRYRLPGLKRAVDAAGLRIGRITYMNTFMFPVILFLRWAIKLLRIRIDSENRIRPGIANRPLAAIFSAEAKILPKVNLPFGVSILCLAEKPA